MQDGWRVAAPPPRHTATSPRMLRKPVNAGRKPYWQCLAIADTLLADGLLHFTPGMPTQSYVALLDSHRAGRVPALAASGALVADHRECADKVKSTPLTWDDLPFARGNVRVRQPSPRQARKMTSTRHARQETGLAALWQEPETVMPMVDTPARPAEEDMPSNSAVAASVGSHACAVDALHGEDALQHTPRGTRHRAARWLPWWNGLPCVWRNAARPVTIVDLFVTCPWHSEAGAQPCRARRNTGAKQTAALGAREPVAYLGAWLVARPACAPREEHVRMRPSVADTHACAEAHGLV